MRSFSQSERLEVSLILLYSIFIDNMENLKGI